MEPRRFVDDGTYFVDFLDDVLVSCPRCGAAAHVTTTPPYWTSSPRFVCAACTLVIEGRHARWFGPVHGHAGGRCGGCGQRVATAVDGRDTSPAFIDVQCAGCGAVARLAVSWSYETHGAALEPSFGLDLLLQTPCAGEVLWAYNVRHLDFLAEFVGAAHRRYTHVRNGSLPSRLPRWMKLATNRATVLKSIEVVRARATGL
ncbi:MAG: hypothetical protein ABMA25_18425 [Ilumatobacteraceae bacterium]